MAAPVSPVPPADMSSTDILMEILARTERIEKQLDELVAAWHSYQDLAEAYVRGGLLGARTAARRVRAGSNGRG